MTAPQKDDRRQHDRYDTDLKISFSVNFDLETKIKFHVKESTEQVEKTYTAVGHNINVEGLGFTSKVELNKGDQLAMDVFLPAVKTPIQMDGHVVWCRQIDSGEFQTGVRISKVRGEDVEKTIFFDEAHKIRWSIVLESVFGGFKDGLLKIKREK